MKLTFTVTGPGVTESMRADANRVFERQLAKGRKAKTKRAAIKRAARTRANPTSDVNRSDFNATADSAELYRPGAIIWEKRGQIWNQAFRSATGVPAKRVKESRKGRPVRESKAGKAPKVSDDTPVMPLRGSSPNDAHMADVANYTLRMGHPANVPMSLGDYISALGDPTPSQGGWQ